MVAIKLIVASLVSLALAQPIEPRSPDLASQLSQRIHELGNTVGDLLGEVNEEIAQQFNELSDQVLSVVDEKLNQVSKVVGEVHEELRQGIEDVVDQVNELDLGNIVGQILVSVGQLQQLLLDDRLPEPLRAALKDLLGEVTSLKDEIPSTDSTSDVTDKLGDLENTLNRMIDDKATQS